MADDIARRRFLTQLTYALGVTAAGGSPAWRASAAAQPPQRKTPSGDLLETVPRGALPSYARTGFAQQVRIESKTAKFRALNSQ